VDACTGLGLAPLHLAALRGSAATVAALLRAGAAPAAGTAGAPLGQHLSAGSTALHIAAARGHAPCASVLLDFQAALPGAPPRGGPGGSGLYCVRSPFFGDAAWSRQACAPTKPAAQAGRELEAWGAHRRHRAWRPQPPRMRGCGPIRIAHACSCGKPGGVARVRSGHVRPAGAAPQPGAASVFRAGRRGADGLSALRAAGLELRRIRNSRGLKPSQLARLAGHHSLALLLSSSRAAAGGVEGGAGPGAARAASRAERAARADGREERGGATAHGERRSGRERRRSYVTQEAVLLALVQARRAAQNLPYPMLRRPLLTPRRCGSAARAELVRWRPCRESAC